MPSIGAVYDERLHAKRPRRISVTPIPDYYNSIHMEKYAEKKE
jgi:hypothetical protein